MEKRILITIALCLLISTVAAALPPFVGEDLFIKNPRGEEEFIFFRSNNTYLLMDFEDEIEEGEFEWGSDDTGDYIQLFPDNYQDWTVESYEKWYYVYTLGILVFYTPEKVVKAYFPSKWHLLEAEYFATSSLIIDETRKKQFYPQNLFNYFKAEEPSLANCWISDPEVDTNPGESTKLRVSFKNPPYRQSNPNSTTVSLRGVIIFNGNQESEDSYQEYGRIKKGAFFFSPQGKEDVAFQDTGKPQIFLFPPADPKVEVTLYVDEFYAGNKKDTVALTKMMFFGARAF